MPRSRSPSNRGHLAIVASTRLLMHAITWALGPVIEATTA